MGTDAGLVYWDQNKFYVWDTTNLPSLANNQITFVQSRPNGYVFFGAGNPDTTSGTGLYLFNGDTLTVYNTSNSSLPSNDVISIMLTARIDRANTISDAAERQASSINATMAIAAKMQTAMRGLLVTGSSEYSRNYQTFSETFDTLLAEAVANAQGEQAMLTPLAIIRGGAGFIPG